MSLYKVSSPYDAKYEKGFRYNDPNVNITGLLKIQFSRKEIRSPIVKRNRNYKESRLIKIWICGGQECWVPFQAIIKRSKNFFYS